MELDEICRGIERNMEGRRDERLKRKEGWGKGGGGKEGGREGGRREGGMRKSALTIYTYMRMTEILCTSA